MSSNESAARLVLRVRRSRRLALYLLLLHLTVGGVVLFGLAGVSAVLGVSVVALSACWHWWTFPGAARRGGISKVLLAGDGAWHLENAAGRRFAARRNPIYFIGLGMIVLVWPGTGWPTPQLVLLSDSASSEALHSLRVALAGGMQNSSMHSRLVESAPSPSELRHGSKE